MTTLTQGHPSVPRSNVPCVGEYDPDKYALTETSLTVTVNEALLPNRPPCLTQRSVGLYLKPLTRKLDEQPPRPTVDELPDAVIDKQVQKDRAFWVDKPGANAYNLHDAYYRYGMTTDQVLPVHQDVFPRSYQYDLDCVKYRTLRACELSEQNKLLESTTEAIRPDDLALCNCMTYEVLLGSSGQRQYHWNKQLAPYCRDCTRMNAPLNATATSEEGANKRWRYYPNVTSTLSNEKITKLMKEVGLPFRSEACNCYNKNYPSTKYDLIMRKFSK